MTEDETAELEVLKQAHRETHILTLLVAPLPPVIQAAHWDNLKNGNYALVDIWADEHGQIFRVFQLTEKGRIRLAALESKAARGNILGPDGSPLQ